VPEDCEKDRQLKKTLLIAVVVVAIGIAATHWHFSNRGRFTTEAQYTGLGRTVSGNELKSNSDPAAVLRFDPAFKHVGGQKFILYGVADTEQHLFVETNANNELQSLYWVQYEAFLPELSYTYDYDDSPLRVMLGDYEFYTDTAVGKYTPAPGKRTGTDGYMVRQLLASRGYEYPREFAYARLVHLPDESRQKELMIIYLDKLSRYGFTAAELRGGGAHAARWPEIEQQHLARIRQTLTMLPFDSADPHGSAAQ